MLLYIIRKALFSKQKPIIRLPVVLIVFQVVPIRILAQWVSPYDLLQNRYVDQTMKMFRLNQQSSRVKNEIN